MEILTNENGFSADGRVVRWSAVRAIAVYKRDLFTHDDICLAFETTPDSWVEVSEEESGFQHLVAEVERRYPDVPRDWFEAVIHPAFVANHRVLWHTP